MNNGNASAASQVWSADDVECVIFRFNDARDVVYAEDISSTNPYLSGSVVTNETGTLTAFFDQIVNDRDAGTPLENYSTRGFSGPPLAVNWYLIGQNNIFYADGLTVSVGDASGGVQMTPASWSNPEEYRGDCSATVAPYSPVIVAIETFSEEITISVTVYDNGGTDITGYEATCTDGTNTFTGTSTSSPITVSGLTNDVAYTCTVTATNSVGTSSASAATAPITPEASATGLPIWLLYQATQ